VAIAALAALALGGCTRTAADRGADSAGDAGRGAAAKASASASASPRAKPAFDKKARSTTDPASLWVIVNKKHPLKPVDYAPADLVYPDLPNPNRQPLRKPAAEALAGMAAAASAAGLSLSIESGYRSYPTQLAVYNEWVSSKGEAVADELSARPGTSEHQTGLAVDLSAVPANCSLAVCFATTPQGKWLAANAWRYGFLLRYPADKVNVTGYQYEPWHFRFIGVPLATELHAKHVETLEEFFGVSGGTSY
jgi:D-alanyl-D-alanine carboxypeptidase